MNNRFINFMIRQFEKEMQISPSLPIILFSILFASSSPWQGPKGNAIEGGGNISQWNMEIDSHLPHGAVSMNNSSGPVVN